MVVQRIQKWLAYRWQPKWLVVQLLRVAGSHEAEENIHVNKLSNILKALTASEVHLC